MALLLAETQQNPMDGHGTLQAEAPVHPVLARTPAYRVARRRHLAEYTGLTLPREFRAIGSAFGTEQGGATLACRAMQAACVAAAAAQAAGNPFNSAMNANMASPNPLLFVAQAMQALGFACLSLPLADLGRALRPGGALDQLAEAAQRRVRTKTSRSLGRWQKGLRLLATVAGTFTIYGMFIFLFGFGGAHNLVVLPILFNFGFVGAGFVMVLWWPSMRYGSALVRDQSTKLLFAATTTDPNNDAEWEREVVQPSFELDHLFQVMSTGWGSGLAGTCGGLWLLALGFFCNVLNDTYCDGIDQQRGEPSGSNAQTNMILCCVIASFPLLLSMDVAATSSRCDMLADALNTQAKVHGEAVHLRLDYLLSTLSRTNRGQGVGFKVLGVVVDKKTLKQVVVGMTGGFTSLITGLLALRDSSSGQAVYGAQRYCALTAQETAVVRSLLGASVCVGRYNQTLDEVLLGD